MYARRADPTPTKRLARQSKLLTIRATRFGRVLPYLLPAPGGFEGFGVAEVVPHSNHASTFQFVDLAEIHFDRHAAVSSGCRLEREGDNPVTASIDQSLGTNRPALEILRPGLNELGETLAATPYRPPRELAGHYPLVVVRDGVGNPGGGIPSLDRFLEPLENPTYDLDVLLRHRLRSISRLAFTAPGGPAPRGQGHGCHSLIEGDLRLAVNEGIDKMVNDTFAASGFQTPGTDNALVSYGLDHDAADVSLGDRGHRSDHMHVLARLGEEGTVDTVEATAVDEQRLVAIIERRPLDLVCARSSSGTRSAIRSRSFRRSASERSTSRSLSGARSGTVGRYSRSPACRISSFPARRYGITIVNPTVLLGSAGPDTVALF
jgi:hypothetical protein